MDRSDFFTHKEEVRKVANVTTDWSHDKIFSFLKDKYENNGGQAEELLQLLLWIDVQKRLDQLANEELVDFNERVKSVIASFSDYPSEIAKMVLKNHENGVRSFVNDYKWPNELQEDSDISTENTEDMPF